MHNSGPAGVACPACGGRLLAWKSVGASEPVLAAVRFELRRCERCGTAVTVEQTELELHEAGAYRPGAPRLFSLARPLLEAFDRRRLALVHDLAPAPARLLDAGAGRGRFVAAARAAGYDATGIEPSRRGNDAAAALGVPMLPATIDEAAVPPGSVDVVTLWHVLEHVEHPGSALDRIASWLRPGGGLVLGVPNLASLQAVIGGDRWYHLDIPRHRTHFTPLGIDLLLRARGFTPIRIHHLLAEQNPFGMWQSLVNRLTRHPSYLYNLLKRNVPARSLDLPISVLALALAPPAVLAELLAGAARRGGTITVLARRAE